MTVDRTKAPEIEIIDNLPEFSFTEKKLKNGIKTYFVKANQPELTEISIVLNKGFWQQSKPLVADFTTRLVVEGTKKHTAFQIHEIFDFCGAQFSKHCSMHSASFRITSLSKHLGQLLPLLSEILSEPLFDQKEFDLLRHRMKQSFIIDMQEVENVAYNNFSAMIYGSNSPYGRFASVEDYDNLKLEWIKEYWQNFYKAENLSIIAVTRQNDEIFGMLNDFFGNFEKSKKIIEEPKFILEQSPKNLRLKHKNALQAAIRVGWHTFERTHADFYDMSVVDALIGGYFGSRLMQNIRENLGLTYSIYSSLYSYKYFGSFQIAAEVNLKNKQKVLVEIEKEIRKLQTEYITNEELKNLQNYMMGMFLRSLDGPYRYGRLLQMIVAGDEGFDIIAKYIYSIKNITPQRIMHLVNNYMPIENMYSIIVG